GIRLRGGDVERLGDVREREEPGHVISFTRSAGRSPVIHRHCAPAVRYGQDVHRPPRPPHPPPATMGMTMHERPIGAGDLPSPAAPRLRRPGWRDPRLAFGLLLVAGSVALGSWAVSSAGRTVAVYAVAETVTPGDVLTTA